MDRRDRNLNQHHLQLVRLSSRFSIDKQIIVAQWELERAKKQNRTMLYILASRWLAELKANKGN